MGTERPDLSIRESFEKERENEIRSIIDEIFKAKKPIGEGLKKDAFTQNLELFEKLKKMGPQAGEIAIKELCKRVDENTLPPREGRVNIYGSPVFQLAKLISYYPETAAGRAKELVKILSSKSVINEFDSGTEDIILSLLKQKEVGDSSIVEALKECKKRVDESYVKEGHRVIDSEDPIELELIRKVHKENFDKVIEICKERKV